MWLSLRSLFSRRTQRRSADFVVQTVFFLSIPPMIGLLRESFKSSGDDSDALNSGSVGQNVRSWYILVWSAILSLYILRFIGLVDRINRKYRSTSVLLTEMINIQLRLLRYPRKKEILSIANGVLKNTVKLLRELERPHRIAGVTLSPMGNVVLRLFYVNDDVTLHLAFPWL